MRSPGAQLLVSADSLVQDHQMMNHSEIEAALDERHAAAKIAFGNKDTNAYRSLFSDDLQYVQSDGIMIDKVHLMQSVKTQFTRLSRADSSFAREQLSIDWPKVSETLLQLVIAEASAFYLLRRIWRIERRGIYTWALEDRQWKIASVEVLSENVDSSWKIAR